MEEWFDIVKLRAHRGRDTRRGDKIIRTQVWKMLTIAFLHKTALKQ